VSKEAVPLHVVRGEPVERLRGAFAILTELRPDVLVHVGHRNDPIAIALMQPGIARRRLIIHHCDSSFALGRLLEDGKPESKRIALSFHLFKPEKQIRGIVYRYTSTVPRDLFPFCCALCGCSPRAAGLEHPALCSR
jgi:hypothetical protein